MNGEGTRRGDQLARLLSYLQADPDNLNLRADAFDAALAAGEVHVATEQVERALRANPGDPHWRHRQAMLLLATSRRAEAQSVLESLVAEGHDDPVVRGNLAYAHFAQGRIELARDLVSPLRALQEERAAVGWTLWLRCQHRLGQLGEAFRAFAEASARRPMPADAWGTASLIAVDLGRHGEAKAWSELALRQRPDQLEALAARGMVALADQDGRLALTVFGQAVKVHPGDGRSWSGLGFARMMGLDLRGAAEAFAKATAAMPEHVGTWNGLGWCQVLTQQFQLGLASFEKALELDRNFADSHGGVAVALARLGDRARAERELELALRLDRACPSALYAKAILSGEAGDPEAVKSLAQRVLGRLRTIGPDRGNEPAPS